MERTGGRSRPLRDGSRASPLHHAAAGRRADGEFNRLGSDEAFLGHGDRKVDRSAGAHMDALLSGNLHADIYDFKIIHSGASALDGEHDLSTSSRRSRGCDRDIDGVRTR